VAAAPEEEATLRYMHTWVDPDGDPETKSAYKFPHHKAGTDTAANIAGVNNALARLSQADIPDADRSGVEAHLRKHREDAGLEEEETEDKMSHQIVSKHEPIRCFEGSAKPHEPFWTWHNALDAETEPGTESEPELELYGYISEFSWFDDDITPKRFRQDLYAYGGGGPITIRMNSYGGDVIAASMIHTFIRDYPGRVTVRIDGVAASAATVVAVAGDVIRMQETAYFMIHDPLVAFMFAVLNIEELTRMVDSLEAVKEGILNAYQTKTGLSRPRLSKMMTDETWMDAQKAIDLGFVDEIIRAERAIPIDLGQKAAVINALHNYANVPPALLEFINSNVPATDSSESLLTDETIREAQSLRERVEKIIRKEE